MGDVWKAEPLDLTQALFMREHLPFIHCYVRLDGRMDAGRLAEALERTARLVPQLLMGYEEETNRWVETGSRAADAVLVRGGEEEPETGWDLRQGPQGKIFVLRGEDGDRLHICMSHVLTDGSGFLQWLYLFCRCYEEGDGRDAPAKNVRAVQGLAMPEADGAEKQQAQGVGNRPVLPGDEGAQARHTLAVVLEEAVFAGARKRAKQLGATANDVLMAAYVLALHDVAGVEDVLMPCPVDLRPYIPRAQEKNVLTVANMTGKYKCAVRGISSEGPDALAVQIHAEMQRLKKAGAGMRDVPKLVKAAKWLPLWAVRRILRRAYSVEQTSYTNIGVLDDAQIRFAESDVKECYVCGTYRAAPSFQVSASTFRGRCTLAANITGTVAQAGKAGGILAAMKARLAEYAAEC